MKGGSAPLFGPPRKEWGGIAAARSGTPTAGNERHPSSATSSRSGGRCSTAFGVREDLLKGERQPLAVSPGWSAELGKRLRPLPDKLVGRLEIRWEESSPAKMLLGTVRRRGRVQLFTLVLRSIGGWPIVRCISPVGVLAPGDDPRRIAKVAAGHRIRICALRDDHRSSYDLTVEDDVVLGDERYDEERVAVLLARVTRQADSLAEELLEVDQPMSQFRTDLEEEGGDTSTGRT